MFSEGDELYENLISSCEKLKVNCDELFKVLKNVKDWNTLLTKVFEHLLAQNRTFRTGKLDRGRAMLTLIKEMQRRGINPEGEWDIQRLIKDFNKLARDKISGWSSRHSAEVLNSFFKAMGLESRLVKRGNTWDVKVKNHERKDMDVEEGIESGFAMGGVPMEDVESEDRDNVVDVEQGFAIRLAEFHVELNLEEETISEKSLLRQMSESFLDELKELDDMPSIILKPRR